MLFRSALLAVGALEGPLAVVDQHVSVQYLKLSEALVTLGARVRTLLGVDLFVLVQEPHMREALAALAGERPLSCVFHLVSPQVRRPTVDLVALGALVLALHDVGLPVPQSLQYGPEALPTFLALVLASATPFTVRRHLFLRRL